MDTSKSKTAYDEAKKYIPGGVNSPVRAFKNVGTYPLFIECANGSKIYDIDGKTSVYFAKSSGTPADDALPKVAAPEPAFIRSESLCP